MLPYPYGYAHPEASMIDPRYIREAGDDLPPVEYNYSWPDNESTETTGEKYVPASAEEIARHPWLKHFEVSTVKGAPNGGKDWGAADIKNPLMKHGLLPHLGRARKNPLRPDIVPPDVIRPPKRDVYQEELHGPSFVPMRRDIAGQQMASRAREHIAMQPTAGTYGSKNFMQPGATYGPVQKGSVNPGFANGLQLVQKSTNKHTARVRALIAPDALHVDRVFAQPEIYRTSVGIDRTEYEEKTGGITPAGSFALPRRKAVQMREGGYTGWGAFYRPTSAPTREIVPLKVTRRSAYTQHWGGGEFADALFPGMVDSREEDPSLIRLDDPSVSFDISKDSFSEVNSSNTSFSNDANFADRYLATPGAEYQCQSAPQIRAGAFIFPLEEGGDGHPFVGAGFSQNQEPKELPCPPRSLVPDMPMRFGAPARAPGGSRMVLRNARPNEEGGKQDRKRARTDRLNRDLERFGPLNLEAGPGFAIRMTDGRVNHESAYNLRPSKREVFVEEGRDPHQNRSIHTQHGVGAYGFVFNPQIRQKKKTPMIEYEVDPAYNAAWLNNPYRNQPVGDGKGGWMPIGKPDGIMRYDGRICFA